MTVRSFAKINLGLEIVGRRADGYHDIRTLFQTVTLADELSFEAGPDGSLRLEGDDPSVAWDETNLILRAARRLQDVAGSRRGAFIRVKKAVPAGRGLGGGSSNAAVTLLALNKLWNLRLGLEELSRAAGRLGADVPYFLHGGLCLGEGVGDRLTTLPDLTPLACLLIFPPFAIPTAGVYAAVRPSLTSADNVSKMKRFLESGDFGLLENDLERVVFKVHPELEGWTKLLLEQWAVLSRLSGSGSAVYGLFPDAARAREAQRRGFGASAACLAETLPREQYWMRLGAGV